MSGQPLLTLYCFPGDRPDLDNRQRLLASLEPVDCLVVQLTHRDELVGQQRPDTKWWGFLFDNEWLSQSLGQSLDTHLWYQEVDVLTLIKRLTNCYQLASRLFRTQCVPLGVETYKTIEERLKFTRVLDGVVEEQFPS